MTIAAIQHIELDERGVARIAGSRSKVYQIVEEVQLGMSPEEIVQAHPHLTLGQVHAALSYYYDHKSEIETNLRGAWELETRVLERHGRPAPWHGDQSKSEAINGDCRG